MKKAVLFLIAAGLAAICQAASVTQTANNALGASGFNSATGWSNALAPSAGNDYSTAGYLLRTPAAYGNYTFAGDSLLVGGGSGGAVFSPGGNNNNSFLNKTPSSGGVAPIITVNNLILDGSSIRDGMGDGENWHLAGNISVTGVGGNLICQENFYIDALISGSAPLYIGDNGSGTAARTIYITSASNTYTGTIQLMGSSDTRARLTFSDNSRMNFVIGANGVSNRVYGTGTAVFNGDFNFDLTGAGVQVGDSWSIAGVTAQTFSDTFTVAGFIDAGGNVWTKLANGLLYEFSESTGRLTATLPKPSDPLVEEVTSTAVVLHWNAAADPNGIYAVNPAIVNQYVFMSSGDTADPNLYYVGATGVDPGTTNPASQYPGTGTLAVATDTAYSWAVVEAMSGYTQNFTAGVSTLTMVDPNNIIGPIWTYDSPISVPSVPADQPVSVRIFPDEPAVFEVTFSSLSEPTVKWYKNNNTAVIQVTAGVDLNDHGDGTYTTTLDLGTPVSASDEGQYYCTVQNDSGPTIYQSGVADLVVKRSLAQYNFDGSLIDSSSNGAPTGTALDTQGDPNSLLAVAAAINYVTGADGTAGSALYLDPNEYVDFSVNGYPRASAVTSNGYGGGLDAGTIVYWVKPNADAYQIILGNFNDTTAGVGFLSAVQADGDLDMLIRNGGPYIVNHFAARPNRPEYDLTDGNWHMMAACWSGNNATLYVDGQWVGNNTDATPASYTAWQYGVLLGASRQASRHLLSDMFRGGAIDNLRIYNYRLDADSVEVFAQEYLDNRGVYPCTNMSFDGNNRNFDNTGSSYCTIDLADFAEFASVWLNDGLYGN